MNSKTTARTLTRAEVMAWPSTALAAAVIRYVEDGRTYTIEDSHRLAWRALRGELSEDEPSAWLFELRAIASAPRGYDATTRSAIATTATVWVSAPERTTGEWIAVLA